MIKRLLLLVIFALLFTSQVFALYLQADKTVTLPKDVVITDNLLAIGESVVINGTVTGDLLAFGDRVVINGVVNGSIITLAEQVEINGVAKLDLYAAGKNLLVSKDARVGKDAFLGGETLRVAGTIYRTLKVAGKSVRFLATAKIKGDVDYVADTIVPPAAGAVLGQLSSHEFPKFEELKAQLAKVQRQAVAVREVISILAITLVALLVILFVPNQVRLVNTQMVSHFWLSLLWGFLSLIIIPFVAILLMLTVIGLPLALLLLFAFGFGLYISVVFASVVIGRLILDKLLQREFSLFWAFVLGFIIIKLVIFVPLVGWLARLVLFLWAFGALVETRFKAYHEARTAGIL